MQIPDSLRLQRPKLVLFDYGETLAHEDDFYPEAGHAALIELACENPHGLDSAAALASFRDTFAEVRAAAVKNDIEIPNLLSWRWFFEKHALRFDLPPEDVEEIFWNAAAPCVPAPGIQELLATLRSLGIQTGVISNMSFCGRNLSRRLARLFPEHSFDCVISSADYGMRKPNACLFELALSRCGCAAQDAWFAGDNLRADVYGASRAGLTPVHYTRDLGCAYRRVEAPPVLPAHIETDDWTELVGLILRL